MAWQGIVMYQWEDVTILLLIMYLLISYLLAYLSGSEKMMHLGL